MKKYDVLKNIRILYVEDEEATRQQFIEILEIYTDTVYVCKNGKEGLECFREHRPDVVITDIRMPEMNGLEMSQAIKKIDKSKPILITTAFSDSEYLIEAVEVGIDGYISKPINVNKLLDNLCDVAQGLLVDRKLKQQVEYLYVMMDSNPNMMMVVSRESVDYVNKTMQNFLGYRPKAPGNYSDFCLMDYINDIDDHVEIIHSRDALIDYFLANPDSHHVLRFKCLQSHPCADPEHAFVISMTTQEDSHHHIFSLTDVTELANENERLEHTASTDALTGIANRTLFEQVIERYIDRTKLHNEPFVLLFFDIDHFKSVNDNFGHDVGDEVLKQFGQLIAENIRDRDFFARWGGEEFVVLLNGATLENGTAIAEHLRRSVENAKFPSIERLTCSFAVVDFKQNDSADSLLKRADIVLYRAKAAGRNCVKTYEIEFPLESETNHGNNKSERRRVNQFQPLILIADDDFMQRVPMRAALENANFRVEEAENGVEAFELFKKLDPALVILDVIMPEMDGFETCRKIRKHSQGEYLPILMITGLDNVDSINQAYHDGATDFLSKPVNWTLLGHKIRYLLRASEISQTLVKRELELLDTQFDIINRLAKAAEYKDSETGNHILRMSNYSFELGKAMGLNEEVCNLLLNASPMHDVGKIGIADNILLKPGRLTPEEFEEIKKHTTIGAELLAKNHSVLMEAAHIIALTHHEKWDGSGYPNGLAGKDIPILGRICAIADVYDALTTVRPYKDAWESDAAFQLIKDGAGSHFDPELANKFIEISARILEIQNRYQDTQ